MKTKIVAALAFIATGALVVTSFAPFSYAQGNGNGIAFGHFVAPGWLKKHDAPPLDDVEFLPPGIQKKIEIPSDEEPEDTTAPSIDGITVEAGTSTAQIEWTTNESAKSTVYISTTSPVVAGASGVLSTSDEDLMVAHTAQFDGLSASTTYYAQIRVEDEAGNIATSSEFSFETSAVADVTGPTISSIVTVVGTSSADFMWTTNEPATSRAHIATSSGFAIGDPEVILVEDASLVTTHMLTISDLATSTTYYVKLESADGDDNNTISDQFDFTTTS